MSGDRRDMIATANGRERRAAMPAKVFEQSGQEVKTLLSRLS